MKSHHFVLSLFLGLSAPLLAIPNQIGGIVQNAESPLNDTDITDQLLAGALWDGNLDLPGDWRAEAPIGALQSTYLAARPKVFGHPALLVTATHRSDALDSLSVTFADAGSWFGYLEDDLPAGLSQRKKVEEIRRRLTQRRDEFSKHFNDTLESLRESLGDLAEGRPRDGKIGKTRTLRAEVTDYRKGDLLLRLVVGGERLIRVIIIPKDNVSRTWLDTERADLSTSERERLFTDRVARTKTGDVRIDKLPVVPQGFRPYCGVNTLAMAARYFGLHIDEDWLAVAGKFEKTGSAAGAQIPRLYLAVAQEAGLDLHKSNDFTLTEAKSSLDKGLPVVVWRRFSHERNQLHTEWTGRAARDPEFALPAPDSARDKWPGDKAPLHASVIIGYNHDRQEVLFVESWAGSGTPRRMRAEELAATAYLTFYFKP